MKANAKTEGWFDGTEYSKNRREFPVEELRKFAGQWVAFSTDGKRILASHADMLELAKILDNAGYKATEAVYTPVYADEVGLA